MVVGSGVCVAGCGGFRLGTGVCVYGIGGLRGGFVSFSCGEKEKDALRRPQNKMKKSNTGSTNLFLLFRFRRLRGAKVVFFLLISAKTVFFFGFSIGVFSVFSVHCGVFMVQMRRSRTSKR